MLLPAVVETGTQPVRSITFDLPDADTTVQIKPRLGVAAGGDAGLILADYAIVSLLAASRTIIRRDVG